MEDNFRDFLIRMKPYVDGGIAAVLMKKTEDFDDEMRLLLLKGKRLRGCLLLYVADLLREPDQPLTALPALDLAVAVELAHSASLILDDMLDEDCTRRGLPTLHLSRGQKQAMLDTIGVLTLPYDLAGAHGQVYTQSLAETQRRMASGVLREMIRKPDLPASRLYDTIITKKTGCLFGLATGWGCMVAEGPERAHFYEWRRWGIHVGKTMQIADDIADLLAIERDDRGKKPWGSEALLLLLSADHAAKELATDLKDLTLHPEKAKLLLSHAGVKEALKEHMIEETTAAMEILLKMEMDPDAFKLLGQVPFIIEDIMISEVTDGN